MTDDPRIIEIGPPDEDRADRRRAGVSVPLVAVVLVAGAAGGAVLGARWEHDRTRRERSAVVTLVLQPGETPRHTGGNLLRTQLTGPVLLINAGPLPVEVRAFQGAATGITLTGIERQRRIAPGVATTMEAVAVVDCNPGVPLAPVPVDVWVTTDDGVTRQTRQLLGLKGTGWDDAASRACTPGL
ncbi:hypothetical protein [Catenuloplanes indicus]|uniref:Uncharacterized protein n=1 Tax=Catenuloplanes indicus TaxID=137267 RepID=A0AAE4B197_9ACTN|nr:hypothetical protein [Catenuloplanes indicus]MDQ0369421.1 hypothetical protein [Catenuloplanes indicus]